METITAHQSAQRVMLGGNRSFAFMLSILGAIGAAILLSSELLTITISSAWAVTGLLHMGNAMTMVIYGIAIFAGLLGSVKIAQLAWQSAQQD